MERHPNSARFHDLLREAGELHDLKQGDYGRGEDPFANVRASEEWGIPGWQGAMIRLNDKVRRLQSLATKGSLNNEAAVDSFMDIAVYALIARVLFEEDSSPETCAPVSELCDYVPAPFSGTPIVDDDASEWETCTCTIACIPAGREEGQVCKESAPGAELLERARLTGRHEGAMSVVSRGNLDANGDAVRCQCIGRPRRKPSGELCEESCAT